MFNGVKTVLIITTHFPPMRGGVESMSQNYLDFIETREDLLAILLTYENRYNQNFDDYWQRTKVLRIKVNKRTLEFMIGIRSVSTLDSFLKKVAYFFFHFYYLSRGSIIFFNRLKGIDVILTNGALVESTFGYVLSMIMRKKLIIRWRSDFKSYLSNPLTNFFIKLCFDRAARIAVNGDDIRDDIIKFLKSEKQFKVFTSKAAIDSRYFHPMLQMDARRILGLPNDKFIILFAASLSPTKFCNVIVESAYETLQNDKSFFYIFIGEGPLYQMVRKLNDSFQQNILFIDHFLNPETLGLYINASNITVGSADIQYAGRLILESLACGTPVLLFDTSIYEQKRNQSLRFKIPLPHVFTTAHSRNDVACTLLLNKKAIQSIKDNPELIRISQQYINQNYEKYAVIMEEFTMMNLL